MTTNGNFNNKYGNFMIEEKKLIESFVEIKTIKLHVDRIAQTMKGFESVILEAFAEMSKKEARISEKALMVMEAAKSSVKEINIIKKEFMPLTLQLVKKLSDDNIEMIKRIDSLEHQFKKLK